MSLETIYFWGFVAMSVLLLALVLAVRVMC